MASIYSHRFLALASGQSGLYTVPAGQTAVIKCVTVFNDSQSSAGRYLVTHGPSGAYIAAGVAPVYVPAGPASPIVLQLHVAVNAGETISVNALAGVSTIVSGFLFTN